MLRWRDVTNQFYTPRKTKNKMKVLPLLPNTISLAILKEYEHRNTSPDAFVFPFMDRELKWAETKEHAEMYKIKDTTRYLNTALKKLARCAGINKDISTHIARHSFAYKAMQGGLTAVQLQGLFNHSSTQITQSYMNNIMNADYTKGLLDRAVGA
jgi:integrase